MIGKGSILGPNRMGNIKVLYGADRIRNEEERGLETDSRPCAYSW